MGNYKLKVTSIGYKPFEKALKFEVKMGGQDGAKTIVLKKIQVAIKNKYFIKKVLEWAKL